MTTAPLTLTSAGQPWLCSPLFDSAFILAPSLVTALIAIVCRNWFQESSEIPVWAWVCFVLLVDVAHVYATLFRTYFWDDARKQHGMLLLLIPLFCWVTGALLYSIDGLLFWRTLAYLAVFHFIRQQYGFVMLYARNDQRFAHWKWLDTACVYAVTLYPLFYWHAHLPRNFSWFVEGDFFRLDVGSAVSDVALVLYLAIIGLYVIKEIVVSNAVGSFNLPKNLLLLGTAISWLVGIVMFNSDLAFTMTNVISHGVPYMALVWFYEREALERNASSSLLAQPELLRIASATARLSKVCISFVPAFILLLWSLAYLEEGLWDGLVWREHGSIFSVFNVLPWTNDAAVLAILIPFLALPQSTHYVLDGFIWKVKDRSSVWSA